MKITRLAWWGLLVPLLVGLALLGCTPETAPTEPTTPPPPLLGLLISMDEEAAFFVSLVNGAQEAAGRMGVNLIVRYADSDAQVQQAQIRAMVAEGVSALLVNPVSDEVVPAIEEASAAGIPIFTVDRRTASDVIVSHIASDNLAGGRMAGSYLAETLHRQGRVVELKGAPGSSAAIDRSLGFHEAIAGYPDVQIIAEVTGDFERQAAYEAFAHVLAEYPEIDGIFAHNDEMVLGAIEAAQEVGRAEGIAFVGFDAIPDAIAAIERGELLATVAQRPAEMGRLGVETAVEHLQGAVVPDLVLVDLALITR